MRRILMAVALSAALLWAVIALGVEANSGGRVVNGSFVASGDRVIEFVYLTDGQYLPSGFTMYSKDGAIFWIQRRFSDAQLDTVPVPIPAGRSMLIPSPGGVVAGDSTYITIFVGGHTDTVFALPWYR